ncbi:MAG: hypothetical protein SWY16_02600 [Cyanobacteriota bacterium]|nr:hypothetical protein [Cyanobacteriota bacterium]
MDEEVIESGESAIEGEFFDGSILRLDRWGLARIAKEIRER